VCVLLALLRMCHSAAMGRKPNGQFAKGSHWRPHRPFRDRAWLLKNYILLQRSTGDIAAEFGVTDGAILHWLQRHDIPRRTTAQARAIKRWASFGPDNPMWNRKGELNPNWRGGVTPERQAFYTSKEWRNACSAVWARDAAACRRCGTSKARAADMPFHVHHIVSFADKSLRADPENLVLLCEACHHFVHSRENVDREHLPEIGDP